MNPRFGVFVLATAVLDTEAKSKNLTSFRGQLEGHAQEAFRDRQRSGGIQQQGKRRGSWTAGPRNETSRLMKRKKSLLIFRFAWKGDRKSTRLNSSHVASSYAVFCLKKKHCIRTSLLRAHAFKIWDEGT